MLLSWTVSFCSIISKSDFFNEINIVDWTRWRKNRQINCFFFLKYTEYLLIAFRNRNWIKTERRMTELCILISAAWISPRWITAVQTVKYTETIPFWFLHCLQFFVFSFLFSIRIFQLCVVYQKKFLKKVLTFFWSQNDNADHKMFNSVREFKVHILSRLTPQNGEFITWFAKKHLSVYGKKHVFPLRICFNPYMVGYILAAVAVFLNQLTQIFIDLGSISCGFFVLRFVG